MFRDLFDDLRRRMAQQYLGSQDLGLSEIAFLLGFSQSAAFHRAFKRWTGQTPLDYRRARRGWARVGVQPRVDTFGERKTAHVFGAISLERAPFFVYRFADVFNGRTFHEFLLEFLLDLVSRCRRRKIFLVIDNGPCHRLDVAGQNWLAASSHRIELFRLPPYSPELNGIEGVWKVTKKTTTHNRFYETVEARNLALASTFMNFNQCPELIAGHVARFS